MLRRPPTTLTLTHADIHSYSARRAAYAASRAKNSAHQNNLLLNTSSKHVSTTTNHALQNSYPSNANANAPHTPTVHRRSDTPTEPDEELDMDHNLSDSDEPKENSPHSDSSSPVLFDESEEEASAAGAIEEEESEEEDTFVGRQRRQGGAGGAVDVGANDAGGEGRGRGGAARGGGTTREQGRRERIMGRGRGTGRNPSAALPRVERRGVGR